MELADDMLVSIAELYQDVGNIVQMDPDLPDLIRKGKVEGYVRVEGGAALPADHWGYHCPGPSVFVLLCITRMIEDSDEALEFNPLFKVLVRGFIFIVGAFELLELVGLILLAAGFAVLAVIVPDKVLTLDTKASATPFLPVSRAASDDQLATNKAEVGGARRDANHMIATLPLNDILLATGTLLVVSPFPKIPEWVLLQHFLTMMGLRTADVAAARPALLAGRAMTLRAANISRSFGSQERAANVPVNATALLTVHAGLRRHVVFFHLLRPRGQEVPVEQVPVRPEVQNHVSKHGWIVVLMLEGIVELRRYAFFGAVVADSATIVPNPARQCFGLILAADHALEVGFSHGGLVCLLVGVGNSVGGSRLVEVEKGSCVVTDCVCRCGKREIKEKRCRVVAGEMTEKKYALMTGLRWRKRKQKVKSQESRLVDERIALQSRREWTCYLLGGGVRLSRAGWGGSHVTCVVAWSFSFVPRDRYTPLGMNIS